MAENPHRGRRFLFWTYKHIVLKRGIHHEKVCALIGKYFGVIAVIFLIIGMTLPTSFSWVLGKVGGISVLSVLLGVIMFGMGMTMSVHDFALVLKRPKDVFLAPAPSISSCLSWPTSFRRFSSSTRP